MKKYIFVFTIAILIVISIIGYSFQETKIDSCINSNINYSDPKARQLLNILCESKEKYGLKAIMFGAWIDGKEVIVTAIGDSMTEVKATPDMHFRLGGSTFTYLTTLLLQLVDSGKISLQDKLSIWLPSIPHSNEVTLDMLVRSTSGYADYVTTKSFIDAFEKDVFKEWTPEELINIGVSQPLLFQPGKDWKYSHTNYVILAEVLKKITGKPLPELLKENILDKLSLNNTEFPLTPNIQTPALHTFTGERGIYEDSTYWNPSWVGHSARMTSNLYDLGKWLQAFGTGQLISPKAFQTMITPSSPNPTNLYYGMGIIIANSWMLQNPGFAGFTGVLAYLPPKKISIYITTTINDDKNRKQQHDSMVIFKEVAKVLAPDYPAPEGL